MSNDCAFGIVSLAAYGDENLSAMQTMGEIISRKQPTKAPNVCSTCHCVTKVQEPSHLTTYLMDESYLESTL